MSSVKFVAIGDSFSEGVGDETEGGYTRGWADLVAQSWANSLETEIEYANLAIRGRLIDQIVDHQLDAALELEPTHVSFNGGGNDMLRPRTNVDRIASVYTRIVDRCHEAGAQLILLSGANPSQHMPLGKTVQRKGDELIAGVQRVIGDRDDIPFANNWDDTTLAQGQFWSDDRIHMNTRGHHRVAARVLETLGHTAPDGWWDLPHQDQHRTTGWRYYNQFVWPWIGRRLTGRSSGDTRSAKHPNWVTIEPVTASEN